MPSLTVSKMARSAKRDCSSIYWVLWIKRAAIRYRHLRASILSILAHAIIMDCYLKMRLQKKVWLP
ncbi:Uncharacterised protein [Vibrio cholerae]|nr:Uncharacterised protein [Vibrio cholerae]